MTKIDWLTDIHLNFPPQPSGSTMEATAHRVSADGKGHNTIVNVAALIFIFSGLCGLYEYLPVHVLTVSVIVAGLIAITVTAYILGRSDFKRIQRICETSE